MKGIFKSLTAIGITGFTIFMAGIPAATAETVVVGIVHRENFAYAEMMKNAFEMALERINGAGGIKGHPLQLAYANDRGDPNTGELAVDRLVREEKSVMLVGGYSSSNTLKMAYAADRLDRPFLVCTAADDRITQHNLTNVYRLNPPACEYTRGLEEFLLDRVKPKSMSIVYENSPYGTGGARRLMEFCRSNDIDIKGIHPYFKKAATSEYLTKVLEPVKREKPEVIFMVSYLKDATMLARKAKELKLKSVLCGGAGGFTHEKFVHKTGQASENVVTATLWSPSVKFPQAHRFYQAYVQRYAMQPDYHAAEAYSALLVAADALERASTLTAEDIRTALGATQMQTPFGQVEFKDYGPFKRQNTSATQVFQIKGGRFETIWPPAIATSMYQAPAN